MSIRVQEAEDDEFFDNELPAGKIFKRGVAGSTTSPQAANLRPSSSFSRLSMAIRRSLRITRRQHDRVSKDQYEFTHIEVLPTKKAGCFTENSDWRVESSPIPPQLTDIKENKRLNRIEKVKKIVRKAAWPAKHEVRRELWRELCRTKDFDSSKALYRAEVNEVVRGSGRTRSPSFLMEDGVVINNYELNEGGCVKLSRMLAVVEHLRPEITSAPMLFPLCALMLHYMDEEDVFACVQHLLISKGYLMTSPVEWAASSHTILALVKKHKSNAYNALKRRIGSEDDLVLVKALRDWLTWIFHGLPYPYVVRIIDCFLVEGNKFIVRAGISIVYIWSKIAKTQTIDDSGRSQEERIEMVKKELADTAANMKITTDTFIATAIKIRNLQSSTIARLQLQYENKVREEVNARQSQRDSGHHKKGIFTTVFESKIVDDESASEIMAALPARLQLSTPELLFRLSEDGASFTHLWNKIEEASQSLLIIRTTDGEKFGAYCSSSWKERNFRPERTKSKYFGTGESFVWRMDKDVELPIVYGWVGNNNDQCDSCPQMFMAASDRMLVIGSGDGDAIRIDEELTRGMSSASKTFNSPPLVASRSFNIYELEVFAVL